MEHGWIGRWSPGIGDPSVGGWITVVAYFGAAWLCHRAYRAERAVAPPGDRSPTLWIFFTAALLLLGINKQLDLQTAVTELGRLVAYKYGWYEQRRRVQHAFVGLVAIGGLVGTAAVAHFARRSLRRFALALAGLGFLVTFVVVRAASFHHVDALIGFEILGLRLNWIFELGGIALIALGAHGARPEPEPSPGPGADRPGLKP